MKNNKIYSLLVMLLVIFYSCSDSANDPGKVDFVSFEAVNLEVSVNKDSESTKEITVYTNSVSNSERTFSVEVDNSSTADAATYVLPTSVTIPSGSNEGKISVNFKDVNLVGGENLVLKLIEGNGYYSADFLSIKINRVCPFDINNFVGTYDAVQGSRTYVVTATAGTEANTLVLSNIEGRGASINLIIELNPDTSAATVRDDLDALIYTHSSFGDVVPAHVSGGFSACTEVINIEYSACVSIGCFSNRVISLTKQ